MGKILPSRCCGIKNEGQEVLPNFILIRLNPQALLLDVYIIPNSNCSLVLNIRHDWGRNRNIRILPTDPVSIWLAIRPCHWSWRPWRIIARVLVVVRWWSIWVRVLGWVWRHSSKNVAIPSHLRLWWLRWCMGRRQRWVAPPPSMACPIASRVTHFFLPLPVL